ncbi:MAG: DUF3987 domain-containing protein [Planctomycetia bacterium]|nr:DUF3987 domain-containing protein [Planctomycetia bacterium]
MSAARPHETTRRGILDILLGPAPRPGAVLRFAANHAPADGVGAGTWVESVASSTDQLVDRLSHHAELGDVYIATAWFDPARPKLKTGVIGKTWVGVEVDAKSMSGSTDEERRRQARSLAGCLPCPSILIGSGGGYHIHVRLPAGWRVEEFDDPADGVARVELLGRALRLYLEDQARQVFGAAVSLDHVHGAERVWRIPPAWNAKSADGARTLTADRAAWRPVTLESPGRVEGLAAVAPADLTFLTPFVNAADEEANRGAKVPPAATLADVSPCETTIAESSVASSDGISVRFHTGLLPPRLEREWPFATGDQSANDFRVAAGLAGVGWAPVVAAQAIRLRRRLLPDAADQAKGRRDDYVSMTVERAYAAAAVPTRSLRHPEPFPLAALPEPLTGFVSAGARALRCAPEAIALPLIAGIGAAVGNARRIELKPGWSEPALFWCCLVMPSGKTKSPAQELALRPLTEHQDRAFRAFREARRAYARDFAVYQKEKRAWEKSKDDGAGPPPEPPERPTCERIEVSNTTLEGIVPILEENPKGLVVVSDELAGWAKSFDQYRQGRGSDREQWLSAHRAGRVVVDRKTNRELLVVARAFIGVCGGIQPGILRRLLTPELFSSGLVARLLLAYPDAPRKRWSEDTVPAALRRRLGKVFDRLLGLKLESAAVGELDLPADRGSRSTDPQPVLLRLTDDAKAQWVDFYNEFAGEQDALAPEDDLGAAFSKLEAYAARFALAFTLVRWADGETDEPTQIDSESMQSGIELARWFAREAARIYVVLREQTQDADMRRLVGWIDAQERPVTQRDVTRGFQRYRGSPDDATRDLIRAVETGLLWKLPLGVPTGGHSTLAFELRRPRRPAGAGDTRLGEVSVDKHLRTRVSPADPSFPPGDTLS